ncbi:DUF559 domain-containing protein [Microbacterium sp. G2-8]|uniref:DUF559 domain-containing protein n=1 Tax=Microbacterium sp. G2-8 TaxID=2842454 RepID=UPI001C89C290|nr:DUF559 domain-containing protein [Microbacterium sp. G2-8]
MGSRIELPEQLGAQFHVRDARAAGVSTSRLRGADLARPFRGIRARPHRDDEATDPWEAARADHAWRARAAARLVGSDQFVSHVSSAVLWGAPVVVRSDADVDITVVGEGSFPRAAGVRGHRVRADMVSVRDLDGICVSSPASTWAMLGSVLSVDDLVIAGDFFCRVWRDGHRRRDVGRLSLATPEQLAGATEAGRRRGAKKLREALPQIRLDSWSPKETRTRLVLTRAGLPEPDLNVDVFDDWGRFLACVDLCFPRQKVAVEYQGWHHSAQYAQDIERIERLRAAGWIVIQVTSELTLHPQELARRVHAALRSRGWRD